MSKADRVRRRTLETDAKFRELVWPRFNHLIGGGTYMSVQERHTDPLLQKLDLDAGIDGYQILPDGSMRSLALRMSSFALASFTQRRETDYQLPTEMDKRLRAIKQGADVPMLTIQSCVVEDEYLGAAAIYTVALYRFIHQGVEGIDYHFNKCGKQEHDRNTFAIIWWSRLLALDVPMACQGLSRLEDRQPPILTHGGHPLGAPVM